MNYKSQRFMIAILAGIVLNLAFTFFVQIACWGPLISVILAAYLARARTPKEGAVTGTFVFIPSSIVIVMQTLLRMQTVDEIGLPLTVVVGSVGVLFGIGLGSLFGLLVGKFFEYARDHSAFM